MTPAVAFPLLERHTDCVAALVVIESLVLAIAAQLFHCALSILPDWKPTKINHGLKFPCFLNLTKLELDAAS